MKGTFQSQFFPMIDSAGVVKRNPITSGGMFFAISGKNCIFECALSEEYLAKFFLSGGGVNLALINLNLNHKNSTTYYKFIT